MEQKQNGHHGGVIPDGNEAEEPQMKSLPGQDKLAA
jgi:hypothetical protein